MTYSVFSRLEDLSNYRLDELSIIAGQMKKTILSVEKNGNLIIQWEDSFSIFLIEFLPQGEFFRLVSEEWKQEGERFTY